MLGLLHVHQGTVLWILVHGLFYLPTKYTDHAFFSVGINEREVAFQVLAQYEIIIS